MTATLIPFPKNEGNGAREALIEIIQHLPQRPSVAEATFQGDWLLLMLADRGFVLVPMEEA